MMINISIFWHFFILGLFSFGGPIAHIGYFRKKFVEELKWLNDEEFSKIVALSQFLPGPSSSQEIQVLQILNHKYLKFHLE